MVGSSKLDRLENPFSSLYSGALGEYIIDSSITRLNYRIDEVEAAKKYYLSLKKTSAHPGEIIRETDKRDVDIATLLPYLTLRHEDQHFANVNTTTTGLYLWKLLVIIRQAVIFLANEMSKKRGDEVLSLEHIFECYSVTSTGKSYRKWTPAQVSATHEVVIVTALLNGILDGRHTSRAAFFNNYVAAEKLIAQRTEVVVDHLFLGEVSNPSDPLVSNESLTGIEILELSALSTELELLRKTRCSFRSVEEWKKERLTSPKYEKAFRTYYEKIQNPLATTSMCTLSFFGFLSPQMRAIRDNFSYGEKTRVFPPDTFLLHNHPSYLFDLIFHQASSDFIKVDKDRQQIWEYLNLDDEWFGFREKNLRLSKGRLWGKDFTANSVRNAIRDRQGRISKEEYLALKSTTPNTRYIEARFRVAAKERTESGLKFDFRHSGLHGSSVCVCTDGVFLNTSMAEAKVDGALIFSILYDLSLNQMIANFLSSERDRYTIPISVIASEFGLKETNSRSLLSGTLPDDFIDCYL